MPSTGFRIAPAKDNPIRTTGARIVKQALEKRGLTQTEAAFLMRDAPSQISLVVTGKLRGFSESRVLRMVNRLGFDAEVIIRPAKGKVGKTFVTDKSRT